jgi:hypothetical protein
MERSKEKMNRERKGGIPEEVFERLCAVNSGRMVGMQRLRLRRKRIWFDVGRRETNKGSHRVT